MSRETTRGFAYVATGSGYVDEARRSAESLRAHHPDDRICLITDDPATGGPLFDDVIVRTDAEHKPIDKLLVAHCPYERVIFLDTDTRVCGDLGPVFDLLEHFDLAVHQDTSRGWDYELAGVPMAFSEFNTGVIAFRQTETVRAFFAEWGRAHRVLAAERGFVNDQPAFRQVLYESSLRVAPLPSEFHFLGNSPNCLLWKVRLIHARGDLEAMQRSIDEVLGRRVYIPDVGVVPAYRGRRDWLMTTLRLARRMSRLAIRRPADSAQANPGKWWSDERRAAKPSQEIAK